MVNQCSHLSNLPTQMVLETELTEVSVSDAVVRGMGELQAPIGLYLYYMKGDRRSGYVRTHVPML